VTATRSMPVTAWLPLQEAAAGFRAECASLEQLVSELYAEVDRLSEGLAAKAEALEEGRRRLDAERNETARLSHQLDQQETQFSAALEEIRALREEFAKRPEVPKDDKDQPIELLRQQITELQVERATLLERLRTAAEAPSDSAVADLPSDHAVEIISLQQHRQELEQALEVARARCSELQATVDGQKQELSQHRSQVSEELKELRTLIEEQTMLLVPPEEPSQASDRQEEHHAARPHQSSAPAEDSKHAPDPLVNSVMAQFAKLQRDISQRRKKK
jgi:chromosome segregation ATPase